MMPGPAQTVVVTSTQPPPQHYTHPTITTLAPLGKTYDSSFLRVIIELFKYRITMYQGLACRTPWAHIALYILIILSRHSAVRCPRTESLYHPHHTCKCIIHSHITLGTLNTHHIHIIHLRPLHLRLGRITHHNLHRHRERVIYTRCNNLYQ